MKKVSVVFIGLVLTMLCFVSCASINANTVKGNGNVITKEYQISALNELDLALPATVNFRVGEAYSCTIKVDENLIEYLDIRVKDKDLKLRNAKNNISLRPTQFVVEITAPSLKGISVTGSGVVNVLSPLQGHEMDADITGSGSIIFNERLEVEEMDADITGSGNVVFHDLKTLKLDVEVAGSGDVTVSGLAKDAEVEISGSGDINLSATLIENLRYSITGSGTVYYGDAGTVKGTRAGSGAAVQRK